MKILWLIILFPLLVIAQDRTGNGGDFVRSSFILEGSRILTILESSREGRLYIKEFGFDIKQLKNVLNTSTIEVTNDRLFDHQGNEVDALGEKGKITLNKDRWKKLFASQVDLRVLIFHEILRAADINDDDYRYSRYLPLHAMKDDYLNLKKEFQLMNETPTQKIIALLSAPGGQNKVWSCEFAGHDTSLVYHGTFQIRLDVGSRVSIVEKLSRQTFVQNLSLWNGLTDKVQIGGFVHLFEVATWVKYHANVMAFAFDQKLFARCKVLY